MFFIHISFNIFVSIFARKHWWSLVAIIMSMFKLSQSCKKCDFFSDFYTLRCLMSNEKMKNYEPIWVLPSMQGSNCRKIVKIRLFSDPWCPIKRGLIMIQFESHVDVGQVDPEFLMRFGLGDRSTSYHWPRGPRSISSSIVDGSSFIFFIGWALFPKRLISLHIPKLQP